MSAKRHRLSGKVRIIRPKVPAARRLENAVMGAARGSAHPLSHTCLATLPIEEHQRCIGNLARNSNAVGVAALTLLPSGRSRKVSHFSATPSALAKGLRGKADSLRLSLTAKVYNPMACAALWAALWVALWIDLWADLP